MQYHVVTFHKCASNWTRRLFRDVADSRDMNVWVDKPNDSAINTLVDRGSDDVLCLYRTGSRKGFDENAIGGTPVVLCVRDPKDVLVSQYWSWKATHRKNSLKIEKTRAKLADMSVREGMMLLIEENLIVFCSCARIWSGPAEDKRIYLLKYEDLLQDFKRAFSSAASHLGLDLDDEYLFALREKYSFRSITKRSPGEEKLSSHYRKGVSGDWANYFDDKLASTFNDSYGEICDKFGYPRAG